MKSSSGAKVTPKSTHRKSRSEAAQRSQLAPVQGRSRRRHEEIVDAVKRLLRDVNIEDLSHSDIAAEAGISKPSVHYHFPTIAALQLELGRRFDEELHHILVEHSERLPRDGKRTWQEEMRAGALVAREYFNANRPACEALYGPMLHRENRLASFEHNSQTGAAMLKALRRRFELPPLPELEAVFTANGEILDLFWSASYLRHGVIDDAAFEESMRASLGYLRNFFPDLMPAKVIAPDESSDTAELVSD
ncbi:TetR/AcrR family transcriptional regulator [Blastomonas sp.]|nr:TetR/AcrR family transcriptional regulator [Blastomonas sp.]